MGKLTPQARFLILQRIDELLELEKTGQDVSKELQDCGDLLGSSEKPKEYRPAGIPENVYQKYLKMALQLDIPARVFKDRLRAGKDPEEAATTPYYQKSHPEEHFLRMADQHGISRNTYHWRRRRGWTAAKAATWPIKEPGGKKNQKMEGPK